MADPTILTTATASAAVLTVAGVSTGIPLDLVVPAFLGALWSLRYHPPAGLAVRVCQVVTGALFAAWLTPVVAHSMGALIPGVTAGPDLVRFPAAFAIGFGGLRVLAARTARAVEVKEGADK